MFAVDKIILPLIYDACISVFQIISARNRKQWDSFEFENINLLRNNLVANWYDMVISSCIIYCDR